MITFVSSPKRLDNFYKTKKTIENLEMIEAVVFDETNSSHTSLFYKIKKNKKARHGCALSHYNALKNCNENWNLIIEDDFEINEKIFHNNIKKILAGAKNVEADLIHFDTRKRFREKQFAERNKINDFLFKMIPQWGGGAYLIRKDLASKLIKTLPFKEDSDVHFFYSNLNLAKNPVVPSQSINPFINMGIDDYEEMKLKNFAPPKYPSLLQGKKLYD